MRVGYVVLYVNDVEACRDFWTSKMGMNLQETTKLPSHTIYRVGFATQPFSFELVPLDLMKENPDGLDLASPSICFYVDDADAERLKMLTNGITATEIADHNGKKNFAFPDNENRWFAVLENSGI